jgi:opacity protein-like surface antigen
MVKAWLHISLMILAGSSSSMAEDGKRFEFQLFGGFTASGGIPLKAADGTTAGAMSVDSSHNVGTTFGVRFNELDAVEGLWRRQYTSGRLPSGIIVPASAGSLPSFDLKIDQYHCNFLHHYQISVPGLVPYVMGGLGATTYYAKRNRLGDSMTRFSFALGGGVKYFISGHFGVRGEARWTPTLLSASDGRFWCHFGGEGAQCAIYLKTALQNQLDLTGGIVIRF